MNREFLGRCYRATLVLIALAVPFVFVYAGPKAALGFGIGSGLGVLNLRLIEECAVNLVRPDGARKGRFAIAALLKFGLVYGAGYMCLSRGVGTPLSLMLGFPLVFAVIVLKALGLVYLKRAGIEPPRSGDASALHGKDPR